MTDSDPHYLPAPPGVPADLARPGLRYRMIVAVVLAALFLFLLNYLALMAANVVVLLWAIAPPDEVLTAFSGSVAARITLIAMRLGLCAASAMFFAFLFKGFLPRHADPALDYLEITQEDQPLLFKFIRQVCTEIGCALPARVYLSYDANASVFYPTSIVSLFATPARSLHLGLGVVNVLDLAEFKALLAHEFGHFSQRSLRLTGYVMLVHQVLRNMVFDRDRWDDWMVRGFDVPVVSAAIVPLYMAVEWTRKLLGWFFRALDWAYLSLSRQMEFNADLVAVSAAGSDALVHLLLKSDGAAVALDRAAADLALAAEHRQFTRDLFYHQEKAAGRGDAGPVIHSGPEPVFSPSTRSTTPMWATHPSHFDRERNAKRCYVPGPSDQRAAWLLFQDADALREEVTRQYYWLRHHVDLQEPLIDPERVAAFLDEERAVLVFDTRYRGVYDNRLLLLPGLEELVEDARRMGAPPADQLAQSVRALYSDALAAWVDERRRRLDDHGNRETDEDRQYMERFDRSVFTLHYFIAAQRFELEQYQQRYAFHLGLQQLLCTTWDQVARVESVLNFLYTHRTIGVDEIGRLLEPLLEVREGLDEIYTQAACLALPPLKHHTAGALVSELLPLRPETANLKSSETALNPGTLTVLHRQLLAIGDRLNRLQAKSLNGILQMQESLACDRSAAREVNAVPVAPPSR
jgi:Zn-dependent protease with chaperone function